MRSDHHGVAAACRGCIGVPRVGTPSRSPGRSGTPAAPPRTPTPSSTSPAAGRTTSPVSEPRYKDE